MLCSQGAGSGRQGAQRGMLDFLGLQFFIPEGCFVVRRRLAASLAHVSFGNQKCLQKLPNVSGAELPQAGKRSSQSRHFEGFSLLP